MKKLFYSLLFLLTSTVFMQAQDVITKHDGEDIQAKILEVNQNEIKYKRSNNPDGPTFTISKSEVLMVRYADGSKDLFNTTPQQPVVQQQPATQPRQQQTYQPAQQQAYQQPAAQPRNNTAQPDGTFAGEMRNMFRKDPNASISYGIRAGFNLSSFRGTFVNSYIDEMDGDNSAKFKTRPGFQIGAIVDIPVTYGFYIQPGLYFTTRGARFVVKESETLYEIEYSASYKEIYRPFYLQVPILASFRANVTKSLQVQLNTGPYLAIGLGGKEVDIEDYTDSAGNEEHEKDKYKFFGESKEDEYHFGAKRFDFGWCFGAGLTISGGFYVGIQYDLGCVNMLLEKEWGNGWGNLYNGNFAIQAGYNF